MARATDTAKAILKPKGIKAVPVKTLLPLDAGKFTGMKKDDAKADMKYYHEHTADRIPGGESIEGMHKRVTPILFKAFRAGIRTGKPSLVSAHSSIIHSLGHILTKTIRQHWWSPVEWLRLCSTERISTQYLS